VKIKQLTVFNLKLPFNNKHAHDSDRWPYGQSILVKVEDEKGFVGYGEGRPCPDLTGETVVSATQMIAYVLWPAIANFNFPDFSSDADALAILEFFQKVRVSESHPHVRSWNVSWCAVEMALIDCALRRASFSFGNVFEPKRKVLEYTGVITARDPAVIADLAKKKVDAGFSQVRIKITQDYVRQIEAARSVLDRNFPIVVDANGCFSFDEGLSACRELKERFDVSLVEDPIPRGKYQLGRFIEFCQKSKVDIMADNWLITDKDLERLTAKPSVSVFYLKVSRCGGIYQTMKMAQKAYQSGIGIAIGSHVGETGMLSLVGRHIGAWLPEVFFISGSAGIGRLREDIIVEDVRPGCSGSAETSQNIGFGYTVKPDIIDKFSMYKKVLN